MEYNLNHPQTFLSHHSTSQVFIFLPSQPKALIGAGAMRACYVGNSQYLVHRSSACKSSVKMRVENTDKGLVTKLVCLQLNSKLQSSRFSFPVGSFLTNMNFVYDYWTQKFLLSNSSWYCIPVNRSDILRIICLQQNLRQRRNFLGKTKLEYNVKVDIVTWVLNF